MVYRAIISWHLKSAVSRRLETIPGIGVLTTTAIVIYAGVLKSGRQVAAWIGLTPRLNGTGGKVGLGRISKAGDRNLAVARCSARPTWCITRGVSGNRNHGSMDCLLDVLFGPN
jgi:transposase